MPAYYTIENTVTQYRAAKMLGVTTPTMNGYVKEGRLQLVDVNGHKRIPVEDVLDFNQPSLFKNIRQASIDALKAALHDLQHGKIDHDTYCSKVMKRIINDPEIKAAIEQSTLRYREPATV